MVAINKTSENLFGVEDRWEEHSQRGRPFQTAEEDLAEMGLTWREAAE